jgi:5-methylcytosine-specific restriction endonuclease McrA
MSRTPIPPRLREQVVRLWGDRCLRCGNSHPVMDHVIPESWGGPTELTNLQPLCRLCNEAKGDRSAADSRPWDHPVMVTWSEYGFLDWPDNVAPPARLGLERTSNGWVDMRATDIVGCGW